MRCSSMLSSLLILGAASAASLHRELGGDSQAHVLVTRDATSIDPTSSASSTTREDVQVKKVVQVNGKLDTTNTQTSSCSMSTFATSTTLFPDLRFQGIAVVTSCKNELPITSCSPALLCGATTPAAPVQSPSTSPQSAPTPTQSFGVPAPDWLKPASSVGTPNAPTSSCSESTFTTRTTEFPFVGVAVVTSCENQLPITSCRPAMLCGRHRRGLIAQRDLTQYERAEQIATLTADGVAIAHHISSTPNPQEVSAWVFLAEHSLNEPTAAVTMSGQTTTWTLQGRPQPFRGIPSSIINNKRFAIVATVTSSSSSASTPSSKAQTSAWSSALERAMQEAKSLTSATESLPTTQSIEVLPVEHVTVTELGPQNFFQSSHSSEDPPKGPLVKLPPHLHGASAEFMLILAEKEMDVSDAEKADFEQGFMSGWTRRGIKNDPVAADNVLLGELAGVMSWQVANARLNELIKSGGLKKATVSKATSHSIAPRFAMRSDWENNLRDAWEGFTGDNLRDEDEDDFEDGANEGALAPADRAYRKKVSQSYSEGVYMGNCFYNLSTAVLHKRSTATSRTMKPSSAPVKRDDWVDDLQDAWELYHGELSDEEEDEFRGSVLNSASHQTQSCSSETCIVAAALGRCFTDLKERHKQTSRTGLLEGLFGRPEPTKTASKARRDLATSAPEATGFTVFTESGTVFAIPATATWAGSSTSTVVGNASLLQGELYQHGSDVTHGHKGWFGATKPYKIFLLGMLAGALLTSLLFGAYHLLTWWWRRRQAAGRTVGETRGKVARMFRRNKDVEEVDTEGVAAPQETVEVVRTAPDSTTVTEQVVPQPPPKTATTVEAL